MERAATEAAAAAAADRYVCCSMPQHIAVCCSVLQCGAGCRSVLWCAAAAREWKAQQQTQPQPVQQMGRCVAVWCSVLQCIAEDKYVLNDAFASSLNAARGHLSRTILRV